MVDVRQDENIVWHQYQVDKNFRANQKQQQPCVLWFTGLSGSGKSTIAGALESRLVALGYHTYLLDGDNVRHGLCKDLGFSSEDRRENIRRIGEVAHLMLDAGLIVLAAFVSPYRTERLQVKEKFGANEYIEVFVDTSLAECEKRDPKGLYRKARNGQLKGLTGIDSGYEVPLQPDIHLFSDAYAIEDIVEQCMTVLLERKIIN
ncbi:adenylyl-sulfate kinase [Photobacterium aquae]|nr:adenylyl-sulfate kinase [Photobacterium aquae]